MMLLVLAAVLSGQSLPSGPVPYGALGGGRPAAPSSGGSVDRPDLPARGMGADAWTERVRGRYQAAQSRRGALDGAWTVSSAEGTALLVLQLSDQAGAALEGAWRAAAGRTAGTGLLDGERTADGAVLRLETSGGPAVLTLRGEGEGWSGEMTAAGEATAVRLTRAPAAG